MDLWASADRRDGPFAGGLVLEFGGVELWLEPEGGAWWGEERSLFVADLHLGKAATFRREGVPVPEGPSGDTLARLGAAVERLRASRVVVLGDLFHDAASARGPTASLLRSWRKDRPSVGFALVPGNHDRSFAPLAEEIDLEVVEPGTTVGPFLVAHEPPEAPAGPTLAGHIHPVVRLGCIRLPCFWLRGGSLVLPAFGGFTGGFRVEPAADARVFAATGLRTIEVERDRRGGPRGRRPRGVL